MRNKQWLTFLVGVLVGAIIAFLALGFISADSWPGQLLQGAGFAGASEAGGGQPTYGTAVVDGNPGEWGMSADFFTNMYRAGNTTKEIEAKLYLRYNCDSGTMYALVLPAGNWPVEVGTGEAWIALNSRSSKVTFTAFAYINQSGSNAQGWEASFQVDPGGYTLWAHTNVFDGGESQTAEAPGVSLAIQCYTPTAVDLKSYTAEWAQAGGMTAGARANVLLRWETTSEAKNLGFNLYVGYSQNGPWNRINSNMIMSKVPPGSSSGAAYEYVHQGVIAGGTYHYLLKDVDVTGLTTNHGPVSP